MSNYFEPNKNVAKEEEEEAKKKDPNWVFSLTGLNTLEYTKSKANPKWVVWATSLKSAIRRVKEVEEEEMFYSKEGQGGINERT